MRTLFVLAASLLLGSPAEAQVSPFDMPGAAGLRAQTAQPLPLPSPRSSDVITRSHMLAQAGREALFGYADTPAQYAEAVAYWSELLRAAGVVPGAAVHKDGFYLLPYTTVDGRVIRDFLADSRQFAPQDEGALRSDLDASRRALRAAGLRPIASSIVSLEGLLPTYSILYMTKPADAPERETRLRVLKTGGSALDTGLMGTGVIVVSAPQPWLAVYIGRETGALAFGAKDQRDAAAVSAKRRAALVSQGKVVFGEKILPHDQDEFKLAVLLYFYQ